MPISSGPRYTQFPDELLDFWMPRLGDAEWRVLCYIVRHTFGWKKDADAISYEQFIHGITRRDGATVDGGCGVKSTASITKALAGLEAKELIRREPSRGGHGRVQTSSYRIWVLDEEPGLPLAASQLQPVKSAQTLVSEVCPTGDDRLQPLKSDRLHLLKTQKITTSQKITNEQETGVVAATPPRASSSTAIVSTEHDHEATNGRVLALALAREVFGSRTSTDKTLARYEAFMLSLLDRGHDWDDLWTWMYWMDSGRRYWRGKSRIFCEEQMLKDLTDWEASGKPEPIPDSALVPYYHGRRIDTASVASREAAGTAHEIEWRVR